MVRMQSLLDTRGAPKDSPSNLQPARARACMPPRCSLALVFLCALGLVACGNNATSYDSGGNNTPPGPPPTVSLSAVPTTVAPGGSTLLTWSSSDASSCNATQAWSGDKTVSGSQTISSIMTTSIYTLTCTGSGGSTTRSVTVNVVAAGTGVNGTVDSSLLDRHQESVNFVYAFTGSNTTTGTPVATAPVTQDAGGCTFRYDLAGLADGSYTVALTRDGGTTFPRSANVTLAGSAVVQNFTPTRVLQVGPGKQFAHPNNITGLQSGDVVEIDPGVYTNTQKVWTTNNVTFRGVGGRAHLVAPATISNQKAIWVTQGQNTAVENIEFSGAAVPDLNGSGIRAENQDLVICGSYIHDNQEGILADGRNILIEYTEFARNGNCIDPAGCSHNMYISSASRFTLRHSYSHHAITGHLVKSRAQENYILYNRIMDEVNGSSSYVIDLPNGGLSYVIGNLLQKGPNTSNPSTTLIYADDSLAANSALYVVNNTFVNDVGSGTFVEMVRGTATLKNNLFVGGGSVSSGGTVTQVTNRSTNTPAFADRTNFDYHPTATTPGIDQGAAPGLGGAFDLTPVFQYVHPTNREPRSTVNAIDIGAYEYNP